MATVTVNLYAMLRKYVDGKPSVEVDIEPGQTIEQVLDQLGVPLDKTRVLFVDSRAVQPSETLQGGEQVGVFSAIGGG